MPTAEFTFTADDLSRVVNAHRAYSDLYDAYGLSFTDDDIRDQLNWAAEAARGKKQVSVAEQVRRFVNAVNEYLAAEDNIVAKGGTPSFTQNGRQRIIASRERVERIGADLA